MRPVHVNPAKHARLRRDDVPLRRGQAEVPRVAQQLGQGAAIVAIGGQSTQHDIVDVRREPIGGVSIVWFRHGKLLMTSGPFHRRRACIGGGSINRRERNAFRLTPRRGWDRHGHRIDWPKPADQASIANRLVIALGGLAYFALQTSRRCPARWRPRTRSWWRRCRRDPRCDADGLDPHRARDRDRRASDDRRVGAGAVLHDRAAVEGDRHGGGGARRGRHLGRDRPRRTPRRDRRDPAWAAAAARAGARTRSAAACGRRPGAGAERGATARSPRARRPFHANSPRTSRGSAT